jgi:serine protease DegS
MINTTLRRNLAFLAGWVMAGLAIALLVNLLWREDRTQPQAASPAAEIDAIPGDRTPVSPTVKTIEVGDSPAIADAPAHIAPAPSSYAPAVRASAPAVVSVYTLRKVRLPGMAVEQTPSGPRISPRQGLQEGLGSGVIVDAQGHIVTNHHVVKSADQIAVQLADGRSAAARVVGSDPGTDLAVLRIDLQPLPVMTLGRSDRLEVGDVVLAIGNPFGLSQTVTQGIVSATGRDDLKLSRYESFIQTDAAINKGNSGGALVNARGELVGINTAVLGDDTAEGLSVAIPVELVRGVMREILQHGRVARGWIGIQLADISEEYAQSEAIPLAGVVIWELHPSSPALQAGLTKYDKIETIDGQPALTGKQTIARVANRKPGTSIRITGMRAQDKQPFSLELDVIEPPPGTQRE